MNSREFYQFNLLNSKTIKYLVKDRKKINIRKIFKCLQIDYKINTFKTSCFHRN